MWDRGTFIQLVQQNPLTFGVALTEQTEGLQRLLGTDSCVRGFLVSLQLDESTGERIAWTIHVLTDTTLVRFAVSRDGETAGHRYAPDAFTDVDVHTLARNPSPTDATALHEIRIRECRADFRVGGGYALFSGAEWYDQWQGNVTDLAVEGATAFFAGLPRLAT